MFSRGSANDFNRNARPYNRILSSFSSSSCVRRTTIISDIRFQRNTAKVHRTRSRIIKDPFISVPTQQISVTLNGRPFENRELFPGCYPARRIRIVMRSIRYVRSVPTRGSKLDTVMVTEVLPKGHSFFS